MPNTYIEPNPNAITILRAFMATMAKTYYLNSDAEVKTLEYGNAYHYNYAVCLINNIDQLAQAIVSANCNKARNQVIIRGQPIANKSGLVRRTKENFAEPEQGLSWVMLDFDKIALPEGLSPVSLEAIEWVVSKLPEPFRLATYFYQFSSSTGIQKADGSPYKRGLNVHLFYWLAKPISGPMLEAYFTDYCIQTDFLTRGTDKGGIPAIVYGVDMALFRAVQPHYILRPTLCAGVKCTLDQRDSQKLVRKQFNTVELPELNPDLRWKAKQLRQQTLEAHKIASGWKKATSLTKGKGTGVAVTEYFRNPNSTAVRVGRSLVKVELIKLPRADPERPPAEIARLYFSDEKSAGSWFVNRSRPTIAYKYGNYESMHLGELSQEAYEHVRDTLNWFDDVSSEYLPLTSDGYLPDISSFATARNSLILAPTGSGKTSAFCRFARANNTQIIVYAAQTIALTRQMLDDLEEQNQSAAHGSDYVFTYHYQEYMPSDSYHGCYITTNRSLGKTLNRIIERGYDYLLVIDEAHIALDDFMKTDHGARLFNTAIARAKRTIFMTATLSDVQLKKMTEIVSVATGELTSENFAYYQFQPVKRNPLWWADMTNFWGDFVAMLRHYKSLVDSGQPIPRTIIMAPTSKMEPFRILLELFDLAKQAKIASRHESTYEEVELARVGAQPILISSPLFALGLNFDVQPKIFWTYFGHLSVDESQIIQTVNRANRGTEPCEVRVYAGSLSPLPYQIPNEVAEKARLAGYFEEEGSLQGLLDSHYQIERLTFKQLREAEKVTAKALHYLKTNDAIQNYTIVDDWTEWLAVTATDKAVAKQAGGAAKAGYDQDILALLMTYDGLNQVQLLDCLEENYLESQDFRNRDSIKKVFKDRKSALVMALVKTEDTGLAARIESVRLQRLFGSMMVFLSTQFEPGRYKDWYQIASEKTEELAAVVIALHQISTGASNGVKFGWRMRTKLLRRGILASANNHTDYIKWEKHLDKLDGYADERKDRASKARREKLDQYAFAVARTYLATIGVTFQKTKGSDGYTRFDPDQPLVPTWNFPAMLQRLLVKAARFLALPTIPPTELSDPLGWLERQVRIEEQKWLHGSVSNTLCKQCVHCEPYLWCARGRPVQPCWPGYSADTNQCDWFKKVPASAKDRLDLLAPE